MCKSGIVLVLFLFTFSARTEVLTVRTKDNQILLSEKLPCKDFNTLIAGIANWQESFKIPLNTPTMTPIQGSDNLQTITKLIIKNKNGCSVNITNYLPENMKRIVGKVPKYDGPNCFNTALMLNGILPFFSYTDENELDYWLKSSSCRYLEEGEKTIPGDIFIVNNTGYDGGIVHAFTVISDDTVISKNGGQKDIPLTFSKKDDVLRFYGADQYKDLRPSGKKHKVDAPIDIHYAQPFRCRFSGHGYNSEQQDIDSKLTEISKCVEDAVVGSLTVDLSKISKFSANILKPLSRYLYDRTSELEDQYETFKEKNTESSDAAKVLIKEIQEWNFLYYRCDSLLTQTMIFNDELLEAESN